MHDSRTIATSRRSLIRSRTTRVTLYRVTWPGHTTITTETEALHQLQIFALDLVPALGTHLGMRLFLTLLHLATVLLTREVPRSTIVLRSRVPKSTMLLRSIPSHVLNTPRPSHIRLVPTATHMTMTKKKKSTS